LQEPKEPIITRNTMILTRAAPERALLLAVTAKGTREKQSAGDSIEELAQLAGAAGADVVGKLVQQLPMPSKTHYVGKGKLEELSALKNSVNYSVLILDIFAKRARTHEGRLQVELAQHQYLLPRLAGQWSHLERLGGGIGTRGPGESQIETDRRLIRRKIQHLKAKTEEIRKHRALYRQKRKKSGIPIVALVGYTSAGKSTLLNALCQADVLIKDRLFATLDPTTRRLTLPDKSAALITDTVGFIRKLPPAIITAFRATLEELTEASLLIHVVDLASPSAPEQCQTVEKILGDLDLSDKPLITALNKIDLLLKQGENWDEASALSYFSDQTQDENTLLISSIKGWGLAELLKQINQTLTNSAQSN